MHQDRAGRPRKRRPVLTAHMVRDVVEHALVTLARTPGRAMAFGTAAFLASALLTLGLTDAASRQSDVTGTFDSLAAQRVQVTTPLRGSPYQELSPEQVRAIAALPGVTGVAWGNWREVLVRADTREVTTSRLWTLNGDVSALGLTTAAGGDHLSRALLVGGGSAVAEAGDRPFDHAVVAGRVSMVDGVIVQSPAIADLLDSVAAVGHGEPLDLRSQGELVVSVEAGWATDVAPRLATILAPGHESGVLVRYPPEANLLRTGVVGSVDSLVYVTSGAILALGAGAVMVGTFFRVLSERRLLGLYRAIGGSSAFVVLSIMIEAAVIGTCGSLLGAVIGIGVAAARSLVADTPLVVPWLLVLSGTAISLATNAIGALLPALHTVRESPLAAIRSR